ncbi:MAG: hydrolase TatD [Epulopiscium sp. Nele67-Bin005]|nr:MAG: hydrolase TatD [Epulopiscium sp. Nele67-Bin005]
MKIFDSHAHYNNPQFDEDRDYLLGEYLQEQGVQYVMNAGADIESSKAGVLLSEKYPFMYASVGVHPHDVKSMTDESIQILRELSKSKKVMSIGEIGLDYHYDYSPRDVQKHWFLEQLALAKEVDLPVMIHSREADQDTFDILKSNNVENGVIHCYSGNKELAREYVKRNFCIGIGGTLTFKNARKTVEVVEDIPLHNIVIETDCPYLAPVPYRGKRNNSSYLTHVIEKIAEIKNITQEEVAQTTLENAKRLFRIN